MNPHSEHTHRESARDRVFSRDSGFSGFNLTGNETISSVFSSQVDKFPHKLAVTTERGSLTYQQLKELSSAIGNMLVREHAEHSRPIALLITEHTYFAAAILGILRMGRFYAPLDPSYPIDRNSLILRESNARIILTVKEDQEFVGQLASPGQRIIYVDEIQKDSGGVSDESRPDALAYVIFTSGTTGLPKGVMQTQRNVLQVANRYTNCLHLGPRDSVSLLSSCSVTSSVPPLLSSLLSGATLHGFSVLKHGLHSLANWLDASKITVYDSAPSLFRHLMRSVSKARTFPNLQIVRLSSDAVYKSDWELFVQHCPTDAVLVNVYGCSEAPTVSAFYAGTTSQISDGVMPVGYPLDSVEILVTDENGVATQIPNIASGCSSNQYVGEIVLQSRYVSPGYWDRSFGSDAGIDRVVTGLGVRTYRTGDLGAVRGNQGLVHLGRMDLQAKIAGFRVEVSEIEACLRDCPGVVEAAVVTHEANHGERALVAFVVTDVADIADDPDIRSHAQKRLPRHMVPSEILFVKAIPSTPNGKIDRSALLAERARTLKGRERTPAQTPIQKQLLEMWRQLLGTDQIGMEDDFFALDGNSLLAMRLLSRLEETYAIQLDVGAILQNPTIAQLAALMERLLPDPHEVSLRDQTNPS